MEETWYGKGGWKSDPLDWRTSSNFLIGLESQEKELRRFIEKGRVVILFGEQGTGKTSLAKLLAKNKDFYNIYLTADDLGTVRDLSKELLKELEKSYPKEESIKKSVKSREFPGIYSDKPIVLFFDEAYDALKRKKLFNEIKGKWNSGKLKSVVLIHISDDLSQYQENFTSRILAADAFVKTTSPSVEQLEKMIDARLKNKSKDFFEAKALRAIINSSGRFPRNTLDLCSEALDQGKFPVTEKEVMTLLYNRRVRRLNVKTDDSKSTPSATLNSNLTPATTLDIEKMSLREAIVELLSKQPLAVKQIAARLESKKPAGQEDSIFLATLRKKISDLGKDNQVIKIKEDPATYDLEANFKFSRLSDGGN